MRKSDTSPVNILLVDDRPANLVALKAILKTPEYQLMTATSGAEALRIALREKLAVILLDVVMPEMDGFEVAEHLRKVERTRDIPIVFVTAVATDVQHMYRAYATGAIDYLIKPLDTEVVRRKVAVLVDLVRQRDEIERQAELLRMAERREFDLQLAELRIASDRRYRSLVAGINYAIAWTMDATRRLTFVSQQAPRMLGYPLARFLEPGFWESRLSPEDCEAFLALREKTLARDPNDHEADLSFNHRFEAADGRLLWFHTGVSGDRTSGGELHGISVDVTDIKHAEEAQALLAEVTGVLSESLDYRVTLPKLARCLVPSLGTFCLIDEVVDGSQTRELAVAHVDPAREAWARTIGRERALDSDASSCMVVPLVARERVMGVLTLVAETPRRFTPRDLRLAEVVGRRVALSMENDLLYEAAHRATRAREHLLAVVSHDLRTPLTSIVSNTARIEHEAALSNVGERFQNPARAILRATQRMDRLIRDLLDFSQLEFGRLTVVCRPVPAKDIVEEILEMFGPPAAEKRLRLDTQASEGLLVHCDRERVLQILSNLLGNAIKFTPSGGSVSVRMERLEEEARFSVSDTGPGISDDELPQVWERFWRSTRIAEHGVGLGLGIAKGLVEAQGGRISVESKLDVGTTFYFTLPLDGAEPRAPDASATS